MNISRTPSALKRFNKNDYIFDGFAHRGWDESLDGWMNEIPAEQDYPSVQAARDTIAMWDELRLAKRRIWELEKENKRLRSVSGHS